MATSLDYLFNPPKRDEFVTDPNKAEKYKAVLREEKAINDSRGSEVKIEKGKPIVDSGAIDVTGIQDGSKAQTPPQNMAPRSEVPEQKYKSPLSPEIPPYIPKQEPNRDVAAQPKEGSFPWDRLLVGATPLLVGMLTGNKLEGVQTSADYFTKTEGDLYKRELDLNGKLAQMAAKKESGAGGSRRFTAQTIALQDGTNVKATFDSFTGKYLMPDGQEIPSNFIRSGYAVNPEEFDRRKEISSQHKRSDADYLGQNTRVNPITGELGVVRDGNISPVMGTMSGQLNVKQEKDVKEAVKELTSSSAYKDSVQSLQLAPTVNSLLDAAGRKNDPNSIAGSSVVLTMIRQAQRVGVATDKDAAAMGGTEQWAETIERLQNKLMGQGTPLTQRDIADLREISNIYARRAKQLLGDYYGEKRQSFADRYNISGDIIDQHVGAEVRPYMATAESSIKAKNAPGRVTYAGRTWDSPNRTQNLPFTLGDGKVYWVEEKLWGDVKRDYPNAERIAR